MLIERTVGHGMTWDGMAWHGIVPITDGGCDGCDMRG